MNCSRLLVVALALQALVACDSDKAPPKDAAAEREAKQKAEDDERAADAVAAAANQKKEAEAAYASVRTALTKRFVAWKDALAEDAPACAKIDASKVGAAGQAFTLDRALLARAAQDLAVPAMVTGKQGSPSLGYTSGALWATLGGPVSDATIEKVHSSQRKKLREDKAKAMKAASALDGIVHGIVLDPKQFVMPEVVGEKEFKAGRLVADAYLFREDALVCRLAVDTRGEASVQALTIDGKVGVGVEARLANDLERSGRTEAAKALTDLGLITGIDPALWPAQ